LRFFKIRGGVGLVVTDTVEKVIGGLKLPANADSLF
jgi:hypothetical protein